MIEWAWLVMVILALLFGGLALAVAGVRTLWAWEVARAWRMHQRGEVEMLRRELALERRRRVASPPFWVAYSHQDEPVERAEVG